MRFISLYTVGQMNAWSKLAGIILRNKYLFLFLLIVITVFQAFQVTKLRMSYQRQAILPKDHPLMADYKKFTSIFPVTNNIILLGVRDTSLFVPEKLNAWLDLARELEKAPEISKVISIGNAPQLVLDRKEKRYKIVSRFPEKIQTREQANRLLKKVFDSLPFYEGILYNKNSRAVSTIVYIKDSIVNTKHRAKFILNKVVPEIHRFEKETGIDIHASGMLYIRTLNAANLKGEIPLFIIVTLLVTSFILWFFFRSFPPVLISLLIVIMAAVWALGFMGLFGFKITILTAIIPALIIVIGVPNTIFLINKYQQEIISHGNQARSLQRVISKTGNAIFMTNLTTAFGFATFMIVNNRLLREFGIVASLGVFSIFIISILLIPIIYSFMRVPREKHLRHLEKKWLYHFINWLVHTVKNKQVAIFSLTVLGIIFSMIGVFRIKVSGSILSDLPKNQEFYHDIKFFEKEFGGILPLDFLVDAKKPGRVYKLPVLKKMDRFQEHINDLPQLSRSISIVDVVKYAKQAFYKNNPKYYKLPTRHEQHFMLPYIHKSKKNLHLLQSYVDSTGRYARITTFMKDIDISEMEKVENFLTIKKNKLFPADKYHVLMTGQARLFLAGTEYLLKNLVYSFGLAVILISLVIFYMFGSIRTTVVSLIPNLLPLLLTAGLMGYLGIPLKPSTILIFGITLGISVDDTIHFLTKYREELKKHKWHIRKSVIIALRETGVSMFYTSIVLFFGFLVFLLSDYGGTKALGGLVSFTLLVAMFSNLLLLPALLLFLDRFIANKKTLKG